jgi:hypothetical protein
MPILNMDQSPEDAARQVAVLNRANAVFIASIISVLFCCVGGIIAAIIANQAKTEAANGDIHRAESKTTLAMVLMIISYAIGILATIGRIAQMR